MSWFWLALHLATVLAAHVISPQNGEEICENKGFDPSECAAVGCCHYDDGQCWSAVGTGPCSRRVLQSYGSASTAGTVVASTGTEPSLCGLLLYIKVIEWYPYIVAGVGMLVGCLAAKAGCGLARLGRGDTDGARLTALRRAFDGVVVCAALRGVWVAANPDVIINIRRHNACSIGIDTCGMNAWAPVIFFGLAGCVARVIVAAKLRTARQGRYSLFDCFSRPMPCLSVFCCGPCTVGQASSISFGGNATRCLIVSVALLVLTLTGYVLLMVDFAGEFIAAKSLGLNSAQALLCAVANTSSNNANNTGMMVADSVVYLIAPIVAFAVVFAARRAIRTRERIEGSDTEDCCLAFWCNSCLVCQILNNMPGNYLGFWSTYGALSHPAPLPEEEDTTQERVAIKIVKSKKPFLQQAKTEIELLPTVEDTHVEDSAELELGGSSAA